VVPQTKQGGGARFMRGHSRGVGWVAFGEFFFRELERLMGNPLRSTNEAFLRDGCGYGIVFVIGDE